MKRIPAARFKEQCLAILDHLEAEGVVVTKHGRPVARVLPFRETPGQLIGILRDRIRITGDVTTTGVSWDASD